MTYKNLFGDTVIEKDKEQEADSENTPNYDAVCVDVRKYIIGGASKFIPDLCHALKNDWFENVTEQEIRHSAEKRNRIKHKIMEDWQSDKTADGVGWTKNTFWRLWPEFVRLPEQEETETDPIELEMREAYLEYAAKVNTLEGFLTELKKLPPPPEEIKDDTDVEDGEPHRQKPPTPQQIYDESMDAFKIVWTYLFNYKAMPGPDSDIESEVIGPTLKYHLRILKGLPEDERRALIHQVQHMHLACVGFLKRARDVQAEEKRAGK